MRKYMSAVGDKKESGNEVWNYVKANPTKVLSGVGGAVALLALITLGCFHLHVMGTTAEVTSQTTQICFTVAKWSAIGAASLVPLSILKDIYNAMRSEPKPSGKEFASEIAFSVLAPVAGAGFAVYAMCKGYR
jgi:hypothetical protein